MDVADVEVAHEAIEAHKPEALREHARRAAVATDPASLDFVAVIAADNDMRSTLQIPDGSGPLVYFAMSDFWQRFAASQPLLLQAFGHTSPAWLRMVAMATGGLCQVSLEPPSAEPSKAEAKPTSHSASPSRASRKRERRARRRS